MPTKKTLETISHVRRLAQMIGAAAESVSAEGSDLSAAGAAVAAAGGARSTSKFLGQGHSSLVAVRRRTP